MSALWRKEAPLIGEIGERSNPRTNPESGEHRKSEISDSSNPIGILAPVTSCLVGWEEEEEEEEDEEEEEPYIFSVRKLI